MNNNGLVVGYLDAEGGPFRAAVWRPGQGPPAVIEPAGWQGTVAAQVNDRGDVVVNGTDPQGRQRTFLWRDGGATDLGTLGGDTTFVPRPMPLAPNAMLNERGDVVGTSETASGERRGFLWSDGQMTALGALGGRRTYPAGLNEWGQVVGEAMFPGGRGRAWLWQDGEMIDLSTVAGDGGGAGEWRVGDINDRGQVVGYRMASDEAGPARVVVWTVPPASASDPAPAGPAAGR